MRLCEISVEVCGALPGLNCAIEFSLVSIDNTQREKRHDPPGFAPNCQGEFCNGLGEVALICISHSPIVVCDGNFTEH